MSRPVKTLGKIVRGKSDANIAFDDLRGVLRHLGFDERVKGSHHIFTRDDVAEIINLQPRAGKAKPYQVAQVRAIVFQYGFADEPDDTPIDGPAPREDDDAGE
ncbi:MAG: type II toxin-antitoxin system HicA family toxin [Gemmataceae bacterium]|nr:type II toxin-antitoxin system HicA family toxin [Gemmataceae bacterium]